MISSLQEMVGNKVKTACVWPWSRFSHVQFFATLWTVAHQDPLLTGFTRQECWSAAMPSSRESSPPVPGIQSASLKSPALAGGFFAARAPGKPQKAGRGDRLWRMLRVRVRSLGSVGEKTKKGLYLSHILGAGNWAKIDLPYALNSLLTP